MKFAKMKEVSKGAGPESSFCVGRVKIAIDFFLFLWHD